jgi:hypothetical protein
VGEDFQGNDCSRAATEDDHALVAQVLDQAPDIVGVSCEPMTLVLRPGEMAAGKAAAIVDGNRVVRRQMFGHCLEDVGCAIGARDQEQAWAAAVCLIVEPGAGNCEDTHVLSCSIL